MALSAHWPNGGMNKWTVGIQTTDNFSVSALHSAYKDPVTHSGLAFALPSPSAIHSTPPILSYQKLHHIITYYR
jgi:hypothetical protein